LMIAPSIRNMTPRVMRRQTVRRRRVMQMIVRSTQRSDGMQLRPCYAASGWIPVGRSSCSVTARTPAAAPERP
jgi:hypothetical protein